MRKNMAGKVLTTAMAAALSVCMAMPAAAADAKAGVIWYNFADTFISNARQVLNNVAEADGTVEVTDADSQNDTSVQDNNTNNFLTQKPNFIVVNNINNAAADQIVETITGEGITAIFANTTAPSDEAFEKTDDLWYISLQHLQPDRRGTV